MKTVSSRHIVLVAALLVFLLTGQSGVQGYIWCIGENGHAALEYAAGNTCAPGKPQKPAGHEEELSGVRIQKDHCGPCLDLPTGFEAAHRRTLLQPYFPTTAAISQGSPIPAISFPAAAFHNQPPPRISRTILDHRTVVLLN